MHGTMSFERKVEEMKPTKRYACTRSPIRVPRGRSCRLLSPYDAHNNKLGISPKHTEENHIFLYI